MLSLLNMNFSIYDIVSFMLKGQYDNLRNCMQSISTVIYQTIQIDIVYLWSHMRPGGRLNKKDGLTRYGDSHVKDKTS